MPDRPPEPPAGDDEPFAARARRVAEPPRHVQRLALLLCAAILTFDLYMPVGVSLGALYIVPVLISGFSLERRWTIGLAGLASVLAPIGSFVSLIGPSTAVGPGVPAPLLIALLNSANALFAVWVTAGLGLLRIDVQRDLLEAREITSVTLRSVAEAVITTDRDGRVTFVNPTAERLTGWPREAARGRPLAEVFALDPHSPPLPAVEDSRGGFERETLPVLRRRDGRPQPVRGSSAPILDRSGASRGRVLIFGDASARAAYEDEMRELAFRDELTGLPNRIALLERLDLELAHAARDGSTLALLFVDLDGFKDVNDRHGHAAGDALLGEVARRLSGAVRAADTVARLGGDEFVVLLAGVGDAAGAERVARKLVLAVSSEPVDVGDATVAVRPSVGVAVAEGGRVPAATLLGRADEAMYAAKRFGGGRAVLARGEDESALERGEDDSALDRGRRA